MVIKYALSTEKSIRQIESENKIIFAVEMDAEKPEVKEAIENMFDAEVEKVNTNIGMDGLKRAYVKFSDKTPAIDIATKLELM